MLSLLLLGWNTDGTGAGGAGPSLASRPGALGHRLTTLGPQPRPFSECPPGGVAPAAALRSTSTQTSGNSHRELRVLSVSASHTADTVPSPPVNLICRSVSQGDEEGGKRNMEEWMRHGKETEKE